MGTVRGYSPRVTNALAVGGLGFSETVLILVGALGGLAFSALMIYGVFLIVRPLFRRRTDER